MFYPYEMRGAESRVEHKANTNRIRIGKEKLILHLYLCIPVCAAEIANKYVRMPNRDSETKNWISQRPTFIATHLILFTNLLNLHLFWMQNWYFLFALNLKKYPFPLISNFQPFFTEQISNGDIFPSLRFVLAGFGGSLWKILSMLLYIFFLLAA